MWSHSSWSHFLPLQITETHFTVHQHLSPQTHSLGQRYYLRLHFLGPRCVLQHFLSCFWEECLPHNHLLWVGSVDEEYHLLHQQPLRPHFQLLKYATLQHASPQNHRRVEPKSVVTQQIWTNWVKWENTPKQFLRSQCQLRTHYGWNCSVDTVTSLKSRRQPFPELQRQRPHFHCKYSPTLRLQISLLRNLCYFHTFGAVYGKGSGVGPERKGQRTDHCSHIATEDSCPRFVSDIRRTHRLLCWIYVRRPTLAQRILSRSLLRSSGLFTITLPTLLHLTQSFEHLLTRSHCLMFICCGVGVSILPQWKQSNLSPQCGFGTLQLLFGRNQFRSSGMCTRGFPELYRLFQCQFSVLSFGNYSVFVCVWWGIVVVAEWCVKCVQVTSDD